MDAIIPILKDFGFPVALCGVLLLAMKHMQAQLTKAYIDRINTLEGIVKTLSKEVDELQSDRLRRSEEYAHSIKDIAGRFGTMVRESHEMWKQVLAALRTIAAEMQHMSGRPCQAQPDYDPHPAARTRTPSHIDIPNDPPSDRTHRNG